MIHSVIINIFYNSSIELQLNNFYYMMFAIVATYLLSTISLFFIHLSQRYILTRAFVLGEKVF